MAEEERGTKWIPAIIISLGLLSAILFGYRLFIDNDFEPFPNFIYYVLFFIFVFTSIDYLKNGRNKTGVIYVLISLFAFFALIKDLVSLL